MIQAYQGLFTSTGVFLKQTLKINLCRRRKVAKVSQAILLLTTFVWVGTGARAQQDEYVLRENNETPLVEVRHAREIAGAYRDRRSAHGFLISLAAPKLLMDNFSISENNKTYSYERLFGTTPVYAPEIYLGYKYNMALGAIHFDLGYGTMSISDGRSGVQRHIGLSRPSARAGIILDTLFSEPYIAPYATIAAWKMFIKESNGTDQIEYTTNIGYTYTVGALIQLNTIDPDSAYEARKNFGLENLYFDLFAVQQLDTGSSKDPDVSTDLSYGAGLRLEF